MGVTLFYNAACPDCGRRAERTARLDWLRRVRVSTDDSPVGQVPRGEIVVVDDDTGRVFTGVYATRAICMRVPAYMPYGLALHIPPIRRIAGRGKDGCNAMVTPARFDRSRIDQISQHAPASPGRASPWVGARRPSRPGT